jgi:hypothetical protein
VRGVATGAAETFIDEASNSHTGMAVVDEVFAGET